MKRVNLKSILLIYYLIVGNFFIGFSQHLSGNLMYHINQEIKLIGYNGFKSIALAKTSVDEKGFFKLIYDTNYKGMGYLETTDKSQLFVLLNEPNIIIHGNYLKEPNSIKFEKSNENVLFNQYAIEHNQREKALAGWKYLLPQYEEILPLKQQKEIYTLIKNEINRIEKQDNDFLVKMDTHTYVSYFLPKRKLLDDIPLSAQRYTERIPQHIADFRTINFNDNRLYHSGIMDDLIESHYWLLENSGMTMDSMYLQMNTSTDYLIKNLEKNEVLLNDVADFLFNLLEKRSVFKASEYLALKLLTQSSCKLNDNITNQLEIYRAMKIGNTAPDIDLHINKPLLNNKVTKLSELKSEYTLLVFGSSWCPQCAEEIPKIINYYPKWKDYGLEVVFIALDTDKGNYELFIKDFLFIATCDFKKWETKAAKDYHVFATPSLFLLDTNRKIVLRPSSIEHIETWVNYNLKTLN
ncbi:MAG: TlpA family protein disulfide reductase [Vicingaceae bacterium]|nr:TlpA family protein disulfide reductase [Vicingaceae bacterium]